MVFAQTRVRPKHLIPARRPDQTIIKKKKKKRICDTVHFAVPVDHLVKNKKSEKWDK